MASEQSPPMPNTYSLNRSLGGATFAIAVVCLLNSAVLLITLNQLHIATEERGKANRVLRQLAAFREGRTHTQMVEQGAFNG